MGKVPKRSIQVTYPQETGIIDIRTGEAVTGKELSIVAIRLRHYRERQGMEQKELGRRIGVGGNTICNWENGRGRPDISLLPAICEALCINLYELYGMDNASNTFSHREAKLVEKYRGLSDGHKYAVDGLVNTLQAVEMAENCREITELTYFSRQLAAGIGDPTEFDDEGEPIYLYSSALIDNADCVFTVNGDSMEPEYHDGDMVLVQRFPNCPELQIGEVGAFIIGNETYIKIYKKDGLHSFNKKYKPMRFHGDERVYMIGRVLGIIEPDADIASDEDVKKYYSVHAHKGEYD